MVKIFLKTFPIVKLEHAARNEKGNKRTKKEEKMRALAWHFREPTGSTAFLILDRQMLHSKTLTRSQSGKELWGQTMWSGLLLAFGSSLQNTHSLHVCI